MACPFLVDGIEEEVVLLHREPNKVYCHYFLHNFQHACMTLSAHASPSAIVDVISQICIDSLCSSTVLCKLLGFFVCSFVFIVQELPETQHIIVTLQMITFAQLFVVLVPKLCFQSVRELYISYSHIIARPDTLLPFGRIVVYLYSPYAPFCKYNQHHDCRRVFLILCFIGAAVLVTS